MHKNSENISKAGALSFFRFLKSENYRLTSACLGVRHRLAEIAVVPVSAVVTVSTGSVVATLDTDSATATSRQQVQLLVEPTATGVKITTTR